VPDHHNKTLNSSKSAKEGLPGRGIRKKAVRLLTEDSHASQEVWTQCAMLRRFLRVLLFTAQKRSHSIDRALEELGLGRQKRHLMLPLSAGWVVNIKLCHRSWFSVSHWMAYPVLHSKSAAKLELNPEIQSSSFLL